ncbi:hypothetical protein CFP56_029420 [Quercus suber]|uniref:Uncharacterized protein n=1 Tax=Quercus suber TaxID=58331 RepID=A0AAW0JRF1_QUESU
MRMNFVHNENCNGQFARTVREGNSVLILQLGSNAHGSFLLVSELDKGRRRVSIVIPEGKLWSGWRSFGVQLRKTIHPLFQNNGVKHRSATFRPVRMMEKVRQISGGFGNKGKEAALDFQNLKSDGVPVIDLLQQESKMATVFYCPLRNIKTENGATLIHKTKKN